MFIRSERLFLRPAWPEDWAELYPLINDLSVVRNLSRVPWPYTPEDARHFVGMEADRRHPTFLVTLPGATGSRLIGSLGIFGGEEGPELGYWIARRFWGRGYATEAVRTVLPIARALEHARLRAWAFADNPASARVLRKAGFAPTGQMRDRTSPARGKATAPAAIYAIDLRTPNDCGDDDFSTQGRRMAA